MFGIHPPNTNAERFPTGMFRSACITVNDTTRYDRNGDLITKHGDFRQLDPAAWPLGPGGVLYAIWSLEMAPSTGNLHYQMYMEFDGQKSINWIQGLEGLAGAHIEARRGTQAQAIAYCKKLDDESFLEGPWEVGEPKSQGERRDLLAVRDAITDGASLLSVYMQHFPAAIKYPKGLETFKRMTMTPRFFKTKVIYIVGGPGTGKSRFGHELAACLVGSWSAVYKVAQPKSSGTYFDGYWGQPCLLVDEFDGSRFTPTFLNELMDRYPLTLPVHGGAGVQMVSDYLIIISNYLPKWLYRRRTTLQIRQIERRIDAFMPLIQRKWDPQQRWDHSGWQEFGPNVNRPKPITGRVISGLVHGLPRPPKRVLIDLTGDPDEEPMPELEPGLPIDAEDADDHVSPTQIVRGTPATPYDPALRHEDLWDHYHEMDVNYDSDPDPDEFNLSSIDL